MKVDIQTDDAQFRATLERLERAGTDLRPVLKQVGEALVDSTRQRFLQGVAPDGTPWAPNAPSTFVNLLGRYKGSFIKKDGDDKGRLTKSGANRVMGKRPLIGETRSLSTTINYRVSGKAVEIGSPMEYAAVQQFGARKGAFGTTKRGAPIPWGDIPARPFLGVSAEDEQVIQNLFYDYLQDSVGE